MSNLGGGGDLTDPAEWLRQFEAVEGTLEASSNELNDAQAKGIGNRQKRAINKKGTRGEARTRQQKPVPVVRREQALTSSPSVLCAAGVGSD